MSDTTVPLGVGALADPGRPAWRFAAERRLGRVARQLVDAVDAEIPLALEILGPDPVRLALCEEGWALACLRRGAVVADGSIEQGAWVLLAACRPRRVRTALAGHPCDRLST